jgi:hypothetical protein
MKTLGLLWLHHRVSEPMPQLLDDEESDDAVGGHAGKVGPKPCASFMTTVVQVLHHSYRMTFAGTS